MTRTFLKLCLLLLLAGCETTDYQGFKRIDKSIHLKLQSLGEEEQSVAPDRYVSLHVSLRNLNAEDIALKRVERVRYQEAEWPTVVAEILLEQGEGD
jgi:hypothetical protein